MHRDRVSSVFYRLHARCLILNGICYRVCLYGTTHSRTDRQTALFSLPPADWFLFPDKPASIDGVWQTGGTSGCRAKLQRTRWDDEKVALYDLDCTASKNHCTAFTVHWLLRQWSLATVAIIIVCLGWIFVTKFTAHGGGAAQNEETYAIDKYNQHQSVGYTISLILKPTWFIVTETAMPVV